MGAFCFPPTALCFLTSMADTKSEPSGALWRGIGVAIALPFCVLGVFSFLEVSTRLAPIRFLDSVVAYSIGLSQWFWIVPMMRKSRDEGHVAFARGLKIGAWSIFVPYFLIFGLVGGSWLLVHLDLSAGFPFIYTHYP